MEAEKHEQQFLAESLRESKQISISLTNKQSELQLQIQELLDLQAELTLYKNESLFSSWESREIREGNQVSASVLQTNLQLFGEKVDGRNGSESDGEDVNWKRNEQIVDDSIVIMDYND